MEEHHHHHQPRNRQTDLAVTLEQRMRYLGRIWRRCGRSSSHPAFIQAAQGQFLKAEWAARERRKEDPNDR